ncbi:YjcZ family sporulation protein [Siminovitchia fortis]|uniref:YjcZ family sporulation protein n=1 Tax=Siminovitchia fortis TaxID=254758 RepID=A0A443ITU6_9BACI|nr:YjcZ family sporulation protein [Siminovitchia fortis]RWR11119.1 YjcZ family sporulation protein [Siminovitchia fortis]WHY82475.1 YjcZ family sporulation protein [Siminovitchia fortis]
MGFYGCGRRFRYGGYGYGGGYGMRNSFALIVVLFILLIIIGAAIF